MKRMDTVRVLVSWEMEGISRDGFGIFLAKWVAELSANGRGTQDTREGCLGNTGIPGGFKGAVEVGCPEFKIILIRDIFDFFFFFLAPAALDTWLWVLRWQNDDYLRGFLHM